MRIGRFRDRLAVWTYTDAGDEVACGRLDVTDNERIAAGRRTLAELAQVTRDRNRRRAAERGRSPGLPDGVDFARVWWARDTTALRQHVGTDDLWEASVRVLELDRSAFSLYVTGHPAGGSGIGQPAEASAHWRGDATPDPLPEALPLRGRFVTQTFDSPALGAPRTVTAYLPPVNGPLAGCVLADGQSTEHYAPVLEHAMLSGLAPPTAIVGVHSAQDPTPTWPDSRSQEYTPGQNRRRFAAHLGFVVDEVVPWARRELGVERRRGLTAAGFSNGAVWAVAAAQRRPDVFPRVVALSPGIHPRRVGRRARVTGVRQYIAAGALEPPFLRAAQEWADRLRRAGLDVRFEKFRGGHDDLWWQQHLVAGLAWAHSGAYGFSGAIGSRQP